MAPGPSSPETRVEFTVVPEVLYSPIVPSRVPVPKLVTNSLFPETAMAAGLFSPEINDGFTSAPEVVYSAIVPVALFVTKIRAPLVLGTV